MLTKIEDLAHRLNALTAERRSTIAKANAIDGALQEIALLLKAEAKLVEDEKDEKENPTVYDKKIKKGKE